jgi:hypothetical protein
VQSENEGWVECVCGELESGVGGGGVERGA